MINNVLLTVDTGSSVVLVLLDLSAAFDMVDHTILVREMCRHPREASELVSVRS